jgi:uncharacterized protein
MSALLTAVLVASLLGSLHCAGMCGVLAAVCSGRTQSGGANDGGVRTAAAWSGPAAYHGARLLIYALLGAAAGLLGAALDLSGTYLGLQRAAMVLAGGTLLVVGILALARTLGFAFGPAGRFAPLERLGRGLVRSAQRRSPATRGAAIGLASGFLPCGWLYAFVLLAAASGDPARGAALMGAFWLGTVPVLLGLGSLARALARPLGRVAPGAVALVLVVFGTLALFGRLPVGPLVAAGVELADANRLAAEASAIDQNSLPCCGE